MGYSQLMKRRGLLTSGGCLGKGRAMLMNRGCLPKRRGRPRRRGLPKGRQQPTGGFWLSKERGFAVSQFCSPAEWFDLLQQLP